MEARLGFNEPTYASDLFKINENIEQKLLLTTHVDSNSVGVTDDHCEQMINRSSPIPEQRIQNNIIIEKSPIFKPLVASQCESP